MNYLEIFNIVVLIVAAIFAILAVIGIVLYNRMNPFKVDSIRSFSQVALVLVLNFTTIGNIYITPFLPTLRLDIPRLIERGPIRACPMATIQRSMSLTWEGLLIFAVISVLILVCLVFGRALCGWACPFGLLQDTLNKFRSWLGINPLEPSKKAHRGFTSLRFAFLFFFLLLALSIGITAFINPASGVLLQSYLPEGISRTAPFCAICPTPTTYYFISIFTMMDLQLNDPIHYFMIPFFLLIVFGSFLMPRFYCRYICPVGAISSLFNKVSLVHIHKEHWKCTKCNACYSNCPMRVELVQDEDVNPNVNTTDCILCGECIERCPERCIHINVGPIKLYSGGKSWAQTVDEDKGHKKATLKKKAS